MLLIYPPVTRPCEPPAGIVRLSAALQAGGAAVTALDANLEGLLYMLWAGESISLMNLLYQPRSAR